MKHVLMMMALAFGFSAGAQITGVAELPAGKTGEYSPWVSASQTLDGVEINFEYRLKLAKKSGLACHYDLEVKNLSDRKITVVVSYHYYDMLVKSNMGEKAKMKVKPGASSVGRMVIQGCKKAKDAESKDDYSVCTACGMTYEISIEE